MWIPRKKDELTIPQENPLRKLRKQQFAVKFGKKRSVCTQIVKPVQNIDVDDYFGMPIEQTQQHHVPWCSIDSQRLDAPEMTEYPQSSVSTPTSISNYMSKNFTFVNSFSQRTASTNGFEKYGKDVESVGIYSQKNTFYDERTALPQSYYDGEDVDDDQTIAPLSQRSKYNTSLNTSNILLNEYKGGASSLQIAPKIKQNETQGKKEIIQPTDFSGIVASVLKSPNLYCNFIALFFHSNAEDVISSYDLVNHIRKVLRIHVVTVEYPGYSFYKGTPNAEQIQSDSLKTYDYLVNEMGVSSDRIIVIGRSIGAGPATYLASQRKVASLCLISPFTSLRDLVRDKVGRVMQYLVSERFNNRENIKKVQCPTFITHGQSDDLISYSHSQVLESNCGGPCTLITPKNMSHNQLDFSADFSIPFLIFLQQNSIPYYSVSVKNPIQFPEHLFLQNSAL